ncbi:MAG: PEP-CTERM sorting domain-containing protein [Phycisphaerales bacterium]|nr:PEP-CTERM sorting domain-containing protein [Phycisphaerales bacterium]
MLLWAATTLHSARVFADSMMLASFDTFEGGSAAPESRFQVQVVLRHDFFVPPRDALKLGEGVWWQDGDAGSVDFASSNAPNFDSFAARLIDGVDGFLYPTILASHGGAGGGAPESYFLNAFPDLIGSGIDFIRLIVNDVSIEPWESFPGNGIDGIQWFVDSTYEIWGRPVPEPGTLALVVFGLTGYSFRRKWQHNCPRRGVPSASSC